MLRVLAFKNLHSLSLCECAQVGFCHAGVVSHNVSKILLVQALTGIYNKGLLTISNL